MNMKNTPKVIRKQIVSSMRFLFCPRILLASGFGLTLFPFDFILSSSMLTKMKPYVKREIKEQIIFQKHHSSSEFIPLKN